MHLDFDNLPFFFALIIITGFIAPVSAHELVGTYYHDIEKNCVFMNKYSNDKSICVYESSVKKLMDREYAYLLGYEVDVCYKASTKTPEIITEHNKGFDCYITHHPQFLIRNGIPETLHYRTSGADESNPPTIYFNGHFLTNDTRYDFSTAWRKDSWINMLQITETCLIIEDLRTLMEFKGFILKDGCYFHKDAPWTFDECPAIIVPTCDDR